LFKAHGLFPSFAFLCRRDADGAPASPGNYAFPGHGHDCNQKDHLGVHPVFLQVCLDAFQQFQADSHHQGEAEHLQNLFNVEKKERRLHELLGRNDCKIDC